VLWGTETVSSFMVLVELTRNKAVLSLFSFLWIAGRRPWVCITINWGSLWEVVYIYFSVLRYYGRLTSDCHGRFVMEGVRIGRRRDCLLWLFNFEFIDVKNIIGLLVGFCLFVFVSFLCDYIEI
jgi:hypothetical protein